MSKKDILLMILMNFIFGSSFAIGGVGMTCFTPIFLYSLRFLISGIISIFFNKFPKKDIEKILFLSLCTTIRFFGLALGVKYLDSSTTSIFIRLDVAWSIILNAIIFKEKINAISILSIFVCLIGVFIIKDGINFENSKYFFIIIFASFFSAMIDIAGKRIKDSSNKQITSWNSLFTGIELFIISILMREKFITNFDTLKENWIQALFVVLYFAIFSAYISYYILYYLLKKYPASKIIPYNFSRIIIALITGYLVLGEPITTRKIIGTLLILIGMYFSQYNNKNKNIV